VMSGQSRPLFPLGERLHSLYRRTGGAQDRSALGGGGVGGRNLFLTEIRSPGRTNVNKGAYFTLLLKHTVVCIYIYIYIYIY